MSVRFLLSIGYGRKRPCVTPSCCHGRQISGYLPQFAAVCGRALAKSHARSGDPEAIAAYIGTGKAFAAGIIGYARAYAQQTHRDHADLRTAIASEEIEAAKRAW